MAENFIETGIEFTGKTIRRASEEVHNSGGAALVNIAPIAAIVPSAWALYTSTNNFFLAFAIEAVGFASAWVGVELWRRDGKIRWFIGMIGIYILVTMMLIFGYKVAPVYVDPTSTVGERAAALASVLMPLLAVVGAFIYAMGRRLRDEDSREKQEIEHERAWEDREKELDLELKKEKELAKIERANMKAASKLPSQAVSSVSNETSHTETVRQDRPRRDMLLEIWRENPNASLSMISEITGVPRSTAGRERKAMEKEGIIHVNGNGVEVLK